MSNDHREAVRAAVDAVAGEAVALARDLHANPEIARAERRSSRACADALERAGYTLVRGRGELDTAFRATLDSGRPGPRVGILAEYDALPGLGHACGHNLIAGASVAAGLALARGGLAAGAVDVFGCPAEETGFGKPAMLRAGCFDGVDAALAVHGAPFCGPARSFTAMRVRTYVFAGEQAHAGIAPWHGRNALDAAVALYSAVAPIRQHALDGERVHGVIVDGGEAWNVVPRRAAVRLGVRAQTAERADRLAAQLDAAAEGAALMHGCTVAREDEQAMQPLRFDERLAALASDELRALGHTPQDPIPMAASTDVGDVSQHVPTTLFFIPSWPEGTGFHTPQAALASNTPDAYAAMLDGARVLAGIVTTLARSDYQIA